MTSNSTGVMNSIISKLTTLLDDEHMLGYACKRIKGVKGGIRFLRDELSSMDAVLQRLADMEEEQIDVQTKEWRNKVRELSYDIEDCVDRFMLRRSRGDTNNKASFVRKVMSKIKMLWEDLQIANEIQELKARVADESERRYRYNIDQCATLPPQPAPLDPRAPTLYEETKDLVGIEGPRNMIIGWLKGEEKQPKVVSIFGSGGMGKTTLAMEVFCTINETYDCKASISVSRTPDISKLLRDMLFQINKKEYDKSERWETEQLIRTLRGYLKGRRYFVVIDDIWSIQAWEHLKSVLPTNNNKSRIVTTTRIKGVAKSCCSGFDGHIYEMCPLSDESSRSLFFRRIFCPNENCPQELKQVADAILKKCDGLPLAIISISSLLASKSQSLEVWLKIRNSICFSTGNDSPIEKMKRILLLSYYDLPHHLKTCLLYLSVFPEDYIIHSRYLIWTWVAEGLIIGQCRESMEHLGESYLNELVNRSMIQPIKIGVDGTTVKLCRVHDVILDFIVNQAVQENFVAVLNGKGFCGNASSTIRRLSLQPNFSEAAEMAKVVKNMSHLRSLSMFKFDILELGKQVPQFLNSPVLRLLKIEGTDNIQDCHVEHIGRFTQLKYLRITSTGISKLPEDIGNLQELEILDLRSYSIKKLPASIAQLQKLVRLFVPMMAQLPDGIENLQSLEELSEINLCRASVKCIQGLGNLVKLRVLRICWTYSDEVCNEEGHEKACISSLSKLLTCSLRSLHTWGMDDSDFINSWMVSCGSTSLLRRLSLTDRISGTVPSRIVSLVNLTRLRISVLGEVGEEGLTILSSLPVLLSLTVFLEYDFGIVHPRHVVASQGFQCLVKFNLQCLNEAALKFEPGAMPRLQRLKLGLKACCHFKYGHGGLVLGLEHMSCLKHMTVDINCDDATAEEVDALEDSIRCTVGTHHNHPIIEVKRAYQECIKELEYHLTE